MAKNKTETLTVGAGCFWCLEAVFLQLEGVEKVTSGYSGGIVPGVPTYKEVCSGLTGHAEAVQVNFNPDVVAYEDLLFVFMTSHNPTSDNVKRAGYGSQYRSIIFFHSVEQKEIAKEMVKQLEPYFKEPITTEISLAQIFHPAEKQHQDYYNRNKGASYCKTIIEPKLAKLRKMHGEKLKAAN
ncbi:MAG: peptide-methionine (S)-S-oxide reductase [Winogradskyella sp.]|nr:MAG: peptide-methionine (S)-S-oxide reductase [Winogradskyella sp.]